MFACLHALAVLTPLKAFDLRLDTDLGQIRLHQLRNALGIGVVRTLNRHGPQVGRESVRQSSSGQQFFSGSGVERVILDGLVVRPHRWWNRVDGRNAGAQINRIHNGLLVDGHVHGLANAHVVKRLLGRVVSQVAHIQARLFHDGDIAVLLHRRYVSRIGVRHDMALTLLQLGPTDRCIRRDSKNQVINLGFSSPVLGERLVANDGVFLVLNQHEGACADRFLVNFLRSSCLQHGNGVLFRLNASPLHGHVGQEGRFLAVQCELDGVLIDLVHAFQKFGHAHVAKVGVVGTGDFVVRIGLNPLTFDHEHHVIRIEITAGFEVLVGMPFHALAQFEGVLQTIRRDRPAFSQTGHHFGAAALKFDDVVVNLFSGVKRGASGVDAGREVFGAAFRAIHQRFCRRRGQRHQGGQGQRAKHGWLDS